MRKNIRRILLVIAFIVLGVSSYLLYATLKNYHDSDEEYETLRNEFVQPNPKKEDTDEEKKENKETEKEADRVYEDAEPPLTVDWEGLKAVNEDVVGWIYVDSLPNISYPIVQGETNSEYLHMTYERSYLYAGSIFLNAKNTPDFSDASSIVYGHNMRSGSMFGTLKYIMNQESYNESPYFWILTPDGNYRYHIFSEFTTEDGSDTYTLFRDGGKKFLEWANKMKEQSVIESDIALRQDDLITVLSTCKGAGTGYRNVVMGVLCSTARPQKHDYFEDDIYNAYLKERELAFDENDAMSYVLTAKNTTRKVASNGYDKETVVRDTWEDVYVKTDDYLIHYEMLSDTNIDSEMSKTDISNLKKDKHYSNVSVSKIYKEYLKTRDLLKYRLNKYTVGNGTNAQEIYGLVELGRGDVLKITIKEMRRDGDKMVSNVKTLGQLIDRIGWEEPAPSETAEEEYKEYQTTDEDFSISYNIEYEE